MSIDHMLRRRRRVDTRLVAAALGAVTGVRSTAGFTALAHAGTAPGLITRITEFLASGELIADKAVNLPARTEPAPLIGRAVLGAAAAGFYAHRHRAGLPGAIAIGAAAAVATTFAATRLRRLITTRTAVPDALVGLAEDAIVLAASTWIVGAASRRRP
jgi:uncharacterized membrane protein